MTSVVRVTLGWLTWWMTPEQKSTQTRAAVHSSWAKTPNRARRTAAARSAFEERFERQVDPHGVMAPADRAKAADSARTAYYLDLARRSAASRARKRQQP